MKPIKDIFVQNESGDHKYFTMVPNYILNHSSAIDQALYLQMKRFAGENGTCTASKRTLKKQLGIGHKALQKSLDYLVEHKWVAYDGEYGVMTPGGVQMVDKYRVNDIWKMNVDHYAKGGSERDPLGGKVVLKDTKVVLKVTKGGSESAPTKNNTKNIRKTDLDFKKIQKTLFTGKCA